MPDVETGGGSAIGGNVGAGGDFVGRDSERANVRNTVTVEVDNLTDVRTDIYFLKRDIEEIKFNGWERKNQIDKLSSKIDTLESKIPSAQPVAPPISASTIILIIIGVVGFAAALVMIGVYLGRLA